MRKVYNQLRNDITFGKFKPSEHLSEKLLTEEYNVSRASIREVIGQLASQGYLTVEPNRGAVVTKLSLKEIDITYAILSRCESLAASLIARNPEKSVIKKLKSYHEKMLDGSYGYKDWLQLNDGFHELIYSSCGSSILSDQIHHLRLRIYRFRTVETNPEMIKTYNSHHGKILSGISNKDFELVEKKMWEHLEMARRNRYEVFTKFADFL